MPAQVEVIDTGDVVFHAPSGETWLVAFVEGDRLIACGWPETVAQLEHCTLKRKATPEQRLKLLIEMQHAGGIRGAYAVQRLAKGLTEAPKEEQV
jgi:hypothetical protein